MNLNHSAHTLLWFRPLSPLHYGLPVAMAQLPWAATQHIPIDVLKPCLVDETDIETLKHCKAWVLSSPTAAHVAAGLELGGNKPHVLAVMGEPTRHAWRQAGGAEPAVWLISPTGESMGLLAALLSSTSVAVLRAQQGRNDLIESLQGAGVWVHTVAVVEKAQHTQYAEHLNVALNRSPVALYFSSSDQPARVLVAAQSKIACLGGPVYTPHSRIADAARQLGFKCVAPSST